MGKSRAALEIKAASPVKGKGVKVRRLSLPSPSVTPGGERAAREPLGQSPLGSALERVDKGHMAIWDQCVTEAAVSRYLVTTNPGHSDDLQAKRPDPGPWLGSNFAPVTPPRLLCADPALSAIPPLASPALGAERRLPRRSTHRTPA